MTSGKHIYGVSIAPNRQYQFMASTVILLVQELLAYCFENTMFTRYLDFTEYLWISELEPNN